MKETGVNNNLHFLTGAGEMGELIRQTDWSKTSLGSMETWSESLKTALGIVLHSAFPMFLFWGDDLVCFYNDAFRPSLGVDGKHPAIGKKGKDVWAEIWDFVEPLINKVMTTGEPVSFFDQLVPFYRNGRMEDIYWSFCYSAAYESDGSIRGLVVTCTETTETILTKKKLEESQRRLQSMILQAPVSIAIFRGKNYITELVNDQALALWGRTETEALNKPLLEVMPELQSQGIKELLDGVFDTGKTFSASELPLNLVRNGRLEAAFINFSYEPLYDSDGNIDGIMAVGIEVTDQVVARQKIKESEMRFRAMADNIPNLAWMAHADGWIYWYNKKWYDYTGTTPSQMEGWGWQSVHDPNVLPQVLERWQASVDKGQPFEMVFPLKGADGKFRQFLTRVLPLYDEAGNISQWFGTNTDITEQVEAQKTIEASEKKFRLLADSMPQHIWTADPAGSLTYFNRSLYEYTGLTFDELVGDGWLQIIHPDDRENNIAKWKDAVATGTDFLLEHRFKKTDGEYRWQLTRARPQRDADGNILMWVGTSTDIQEQKTFAAALEANVKERTKELADKNKELEKKNKELQSFAYISSHDLQEPLRKIQTFASRIADKDKDSLSEAGLNMFMRMQNAAARMQTLIDDLLTYSRTHTLERNFKKVELDAIVEDVKQDIAEDLQKATIEVSPCEVHAIPFQFHQLFYNLISNSLKFARPGVPLQIVIASTQAKGSTFNNADLDNDRMYCHISVADNGIGFEPQYSERIFEIFQRLHGRSEYSGTGIGLAIVKKIVENHDGVITADGHPGAGATFHLYIPVRDD